jgi:hypothetical protein
LREYSIPLLLLNLLLPNHKIEDCERPCAICHLSDQIVGRWPSGAAACTRAKKKEEEAGYGKGKGNKITKEKKKKKEKKKLSNRLWLTEQKPAQT